MAGLRIESESEARRCLRRVEVEGGEVGAWAREHGIDGRFLNAWRMKLARRAGAPEPRRRPRRAGNARTGLVELVPAPPSLATSDRYVLAVGGVRIEVGDDFSEGTLRRLVGVFRSC